MQRRFVSAIIGARCKLNAPFRKGGRHAKAERTDVRQDGEIYSRLSAAGERLPQLPEYHARFGNEFVESGAAVRVCAGKVRQAAPYKVGDDRSS